MLKGNKFSNYYVEVTVTNTFSEWPLILIF